MIYSQTTSLPSSLSSISELSDVCVCVWGGGGRSKSNLGVGVGGLFEAGRLSTFSTFRVGDYSRLGT